MDVIIIFRKPHRWEGSDWPPSLPNHFIKIRLSYSMLLLSIFFSLQLAILSSKLSFLLIQLKLQPRTKYLRKTLVFFSFYWKSSIFIFKDSFVSVNKICFVRDRAQCCKSIKFRHSSELSSFPEIQRHC